MFLQVRDFYDRPITIDAKQIVKVEPPWQFHWFDGTPSGPQVCPLRVRIGRKIQKMSAGVETLLRAGVQVPA